MEKTYRCSCCDGVFPTTNTVYKSWNEKVKPENSEVVCICRKCNRQMIKCGFKGVMQYKKALGEQTKYEAEEAWVRG
jgi:hypothetical protein